MDARQRKGEPVEPPLTPTPNRLLFPVLNALRECLRSQLVNVGNPVCHLPVIWGEAPLPAQRCDCDCGSGRNGEGWVRVTRVEQTPRLPGRGSGRRNTGGSRYWPDVCSGGVRVWDTQIEMGVWRCAPTLDDVTGAPPSDEEHDAHTQLTLNDLAALARTWACCTWLQDREYPHQVETITPSGPSGGCSGVIAAGRVEIEECYPCP